MRWQALNNPNKDEVSTYIFSFLKKPFYLSKYCALIRRE